MHLFYMQVFVKSSTSYILDTLLDLKVTALKRVIKIPAPLSRDYDCSELDYSSDLE